MDPPGLSASEAKEESFGEDDSDVADDSDEGVERDSKKPREASAEGATDGKQKLLFVRRFVGRRCCPRTYHVMVLMLTG